MNDLLAVRIARWRRVAWCVASGGSLTLLFCLFNWPSRVFQAYWIAWIFWSGLGLGSLVVVMLHNVSGGAWGEAVRAPVEAGAMTLPLSGLLLIPALFGLGHIFAWCQPGAFTAHDWPHKQLYLTPTWFSVRALLYFVVLFGLTVWLGLWRGYLRSPVQLMALSARSSGVSAGGLVAYFGLMLFASTDWVVSLEPQWSSTMFVVIFAANHFLGALAMAVGLTAAFRSEAMEVTTKQWHDLGNLLLAFVTFWAYITFSQFLIIWSGNLPREISWYLHRSAGGWPQVTIALVFVQFIVPFILLLSRAAKRHRQVLGPIAWLIWMASAVHTWWLIAPSFQHDGIVVPWLEAAAFAGIGGLWVGVFLGFFKSRAVSSVTPAGEVAHV